MSKNKFFMTPLNKVLVGGAMTLVVISAQAALVDKVISGDGYGALELCTRTMQSEDNYDRVLNLYTEPAVRPLDAYWKINYVAGAEVTVQATLYSKVSSRTAIFRKNLGCTIVPPGTDVAAVRAQAFRPVSTPVASGQPWPLGEGAASADGLSADQVALLQRHGDQIFSDPRIYLKNKKNTIAFLVSHQGRLIYERYGSGYVRNQPQLGWSMSKSLTALIVGAMATDGKISLDAAVDLPEWYRTDKASITWKQLLNMAPGIDWNEDYTGSTLSDTSSMLFSQADQGGWAASLPLSSRPGTVFNYSTGFPNIAMLRMKQLLGGTHQALYDYYQQRLLAPLGIRNGVIEPDASGTPVGGARAVLRPVDWLRLGQLVLQNGQWNGKPVIDSSVMNFLRAASPASPEYGGFIWRQPSSSKIPQDLIQRIPADTVMFLGLRGQETVIVPSKQLVVVRMGVAPTATGQNDARHDLFAAVADLVEKM